MPRDLLRALSAVVVAVAALCLGAVAAADAARGSRTVHAMDASRSPSVSRAVSAPHTATAPHTAAAARVSQQRPAPTLTELVGERLIVAMEGTSPSPALLGRIRSGQVGGVIVFGWNVTSAVQLRTLTRTLHETARRAGRSTFLVVTDQEGGEVRRLSWAPPARSASELGLKTIPAVRREGRATAVALRHNGVDADLAPVADVPRVDGSFIERQGRAFSRDPARAAAFATAFIRGLADGGVLATAKHFPGLGGAQRSTDDAAVTIAGTPAQRAADLLPFRELVRRGVPLVMLSSAVHEGYGPTPALWSPAVHRTLRTELGFGGVTISDALEPLARSRGLSLETVSLLAARAGTDLLLYAGSERSTASVFDALLAAARDGRLARASLERSHARLASLSGRG